MERYHKISIIGSLAFVAMVAYAALAPEKHVRDDVQIGSQDATDKHIIFDIGQGASNPRIRADYTDQDLEFSNDGTNYSKIAGRQLFDNEDLRFYEDVGNGTNYIGFKAPAAVTADTDFVWPDGDGTAGQVLKTDGAKNFGWADALTNPMDSAGDMIIGGALGAPTNLDSDADNTVLQNVGANTPDWALLDDSNIDAAANITATKLGTGGVDNTEFNILDGATVTTAELNVLDDMTASTAELNILDGVTASTGEINQLDDNTFDANVTIFKTDNVSLNVQTNGTTGLTEVNFGDTGDTNIGRIGYNHSTDTLFLYAGDSLRLSMTSALNSLDDGLTLTGPTTKFKVTGTWTSGAGNRYVCYDNGTGVISNNSTACNPSSIKYKKLIVPFNDEIDSGNIIDALKPVVFTFKRPNELYPRQIGFIAEDVDEVLPHAVDYDEQGEPEGVQYAQLTALLVAEIQALRKRVEELENR